MSNKTSYQFHQDGTTPPNGYVFVFGSNEAGRHGKGAAKAAADHYGAIYGVPEGYMEDSVTKRASYAIPTKNRQISTLRLDEIRHYVDRFKQFAKNHPEKQFFMTRIGCVLAGYQNEDIAPMFAGATDNINFPEDWRSLLANQRRPFKP